MVTLAGGPIVTLAGGPIVTLAGGPIVTLAGGPMVTLAGGPTVSPTGGAARHAPADARLEAAIRQSMDFIVSLLLNPIIANATRCDFFQTC